MKKIFIIFLCLISFFSFSSCKNNTTDLSFVATTENQKNQTEISLAENVSTEETTCFVEETEYISTTTQEYSSTTVTATEYFTEEQFTEATTTNETTIAETTILNSSSDETTAFEATTDETTALELSATEITTLEALSTEIPLENTSAADIEDFCYITIDCSTVLNNTDMLKKQKLPFIPADGFILKKTKIALNENDTAFDILQKACKQNVCSQNCQYCNDCIQLEYNFTPAFNSYYIEGIHQLYEKDCGGYSGWMYKVNDVFPSYSASEYTLSPNDEIVFAYTCDMGEDIGNLF